MSPSLKVERSKEINMAKLVEVGDA